jgi:hypothetical protein
MADANDEDLSQFENWYTQAGTPTVVVDGKYDALTKTYSLTLSQSQKSTPGQDASLKKYVVCTVYRVPCIISAFLATLLPPWLIPLTPYTYTPVHTLHTRSLISPLSFSFSLSLSV